mgnify:CR=1 FL=1
MFFNSRSSLSSFLKEESFKSPFSKKIQTINFKFIHQVVEKNNLDPKNIKEEDLFKNNILHKSKGKVKLLNVGELKIPINIEISFASKKAVEQIIAAGGKIKITEKTDIITAIGGVMSITFLSTIRIPAFE